MRTVVSSSLGLGVSSDHEVLHKSKLFLCTVKASEQNFVSLNEFRSEVNHLIDRVDRFKNLFLEDMTKATLWLALNAEFLGQELLADGAVVADLVKGVVLHLLEGVLLAVVGHDS